MHLLVYDGSFAGILCAVFELFEYRYPIVRLVTEGCYTVPLFAQTHTVTTDEQKAKRVWEGLKKRVSAQALEQLRFTYLSEQEGTADLLVSYMQYAFTTSTGIEKNFSHPAVLAISQLAKKVHREKHRMEAFVRFQLTADQVYYAVVEPDFNVLPVIASHFEKRYADQRWLIYDARRRYGIYYNLEKVHSVDISFEAGLQQGRQVTQVYDDKEELYQLLWQRYFASANIEARKNTKLHIRHMPVRYWKYLVEKKS
jgi:probable DNA metabolism protein